MNANEVISLMESMGDEQQRKNLMRFFKTGKGQYGYGDEFLGIKVPRTREVVKASVGLPLDEIHILLTSRWHEVRLCGFLLLVHDFEQLCRKSVCRKIDSVVKRDTIVRFYLAHSEYADNWDLVDLSVHKIIGNWLLQPTFLGNREGDETPGMNREYKTAVLDELAASDSLWKQRMSIVCTWKPNQQGDPSWCLRYAQVHLQHKHDLMHKAVGWMLRDMGSRCDIQLLRDFLEEHHSGMPRTMLRYAIEKLPESERLYWLQAR